MRYMVIANILFAFCFLFPASSVEDYPEIARIEHILFGKTFLDLKINNRLVKIEKNIFGESYDNDSLDKRTQRVKDLVLGGPSNAKAIEEQGYENIQTKELDSANFLEFLIESINNERVFKGLLPVREDTIASKVAGDHALDLIKKGYLSYFNLNGETPDERYTLAGGTGATIEIIKGFQVESKDNDIKLTNLLSRQLIQAIVVSTDDSQVIYSPYISHIGCGFATSSDKKGFVSVIEFVTEGGEFEPIKPQVNYGEKVIVSGKVNLPYKFKAISIAFFDKYNHSQMEKVEQDKYFDSENLNPYFPPQDYIAFGSKRKSNFANFLKGLGIVGAIGAAPFTGGASAILAPVLLSSIQSGPPREIPLKGGIKVKKNGEFYGEIELTNQGRSGVYFVSILGELPGVNFPIVISRRTVRVNSSLQPTAKTEALNLEL